MAPGGSGDAPPSANRVRRRSWPGRLGAALATVLVPVLLVAGLVGVGALDHPLGPATARTGPGLASGSRTASGSRVAPTPSRVPLPPLADVPPYFQTGWLATHPTPALKLEDRAAILVDLGTGQTLYENDDATPLPTASLAKLVTVAVALQHATLQTSLTVPLAATQIEKDATVMGLSPGEQLTVEELIDGILLESANDAALVLAQAIIPEPEFIYDMNALVRSWGLPGARFSNPTGLDAPGELASAYDLAVIAARVIGDQPELLQISDQREIQIPQTPTHKAYYLWTLIGPVRHGFPGAIGLKTGYTDDAGYCFALPDQRGGRTLLAIVLDSPTDEQDAETL
ncbi:MAG: D-alanyl-D-alanine carboxypeptidase family protein, partial [Candidatus Dormibacteraceae bacterium]